MNALLPYLPALALLCTGIALVWRFGQTFGEMRAHNKELREAVATMTAALVVIQRIPVMEQAITNLQDVTSRNTSHIRHLLEKTAEMRGRLESNHGE